MTRTSPKLRVAAVQAAPVFLDLEGTLDKACHLIATAARRGAKLIVLPEAFVPAYPDWIWALPPSRSRAISELYAELVENAVTIPGPACDRLCQAAREARVYVVIGVNERNSEASGTSLYNTLLFIDPDGTLLIRHRKLVPTGAERLVWARGDGSTLRVLETPFGRLGGLICWENYMPLARYALYERGVQVHVASTWDRGEPWLSSLRHIAAEGRMFVIGCCQALHRDHIPDRLEFKRLYPPDRTWINVGDSTIVDPRGQVIAGPLREKEDILFAELDLAVATGARWMLDVAGHYSRPDVFQFAVRTAVPGSGESAAVPSSREAARRRALRVRSRPAARRKSVRRVRSRPAARRKSVRRAPSRPAARRKSVRRVRKPRRR